MDTIIEKDKLPIEFQTEEEIKNLCLFFVKEIYGNYASSAQLFKDVDGFWVLFIPNKKVVLYCSQTIKEMYDIILEEYEGYILYSTVLSNSSQFGLLDQN
jgi:hypothetical protein